MNAIQFRFPAILTVCLLSPSIAPSAVIVSPYVQNPARDAMTVLWLTKTDVPGTLTVKSANGRQTHQSTSAPELKPELGYHPSQIASLEFAVASLDVKLCVIMGHSKCGAVQAAITASSVAKSAVVDPPARISSPPLPFRKS